jgi:hypothetical protein
MARIDVASELALVAVCDPSVELPSGTDQPQLLRDLEPLTGSSRVFYFVTDDPVRYRIELLAGEQPPASRDRDFEPSGGAFGLEAPTGRIGVYGWGRDGVPVLAGSVDTTRGSHTLSILSRRPFDGARHEQDMTALLGDDWKYMKRVDRLGLVGCLPFVLLGVSLVFKQWRWLWAIVPLLVVSWLPSLILRWSPRYKALEQRANEHEQRRPHFVVSAARTDARLLTGGFLRV